MNDSFVRGDAGAQLVHSSTKVGASAISCCVAHLECVGSTSFTRWSATSQPASVGNDLLVGANGLRRQW